METPSKLLSLFACLAFVGSATSASAALPTINAAATLNGAIEDQTFPIRFNDLVSATNAADADSGGLVIRLVSQTGSSLRTSGGAVVAPGGALSNGQTWDWIPTADQNGAIQNFTVEAFAGGEASANGSAVTINVTPVNDRPGFSGTNVTVAEDSGAYSQAWATNIDKGHPNENTQTVSFVVDSVTNPGIFTGPVTVSNAGVLSFTPAPNENGVSQIRVKIVDSGDTSNGGIRESGLQNYTITLTEVPDDPDIAGNFLTDAANRLADDGSVEGTPDPSEFSAIFSAVTVVDVDHLKQSAESLVAKITVSAEAATLGEFTFPSGFTESPLGTYTLGGMIPADVQAKLRGVKFRPTPNARPVGDYDFDVEIEVTDLTSRTDTLSGKIFVESVNDPANVTLTFSVTEIPDSGDSNPFRIGIIDPDRDENFLVEISATNGPFGTLVPAAGKGAVSGGVFSFTGTAAQVVSAVRDLKYTPNSLSATQTAGFSVVVTERHPSGVFESPRPARTGSFRIIFTNDPTEFAGIPTGILRITDNPNDPAVLPFATVSLVDADSAQQLTLTINLDDPAKGFFKLNTAPTLGAQLFDSSGTALGGLSPISQIRGTVSQIREVLEKLIFTPNPDRIPINTSETVRITLTVSDGISPPLSSPDILIEVTSVNGAPRVRWDVSGDNDKPFPTASAPALIDPAGSARPFEKVFITDEGDVTVTITMDNPAKGELVDDTGSFTETEPGSRIYTFSGTPAEVAIALHGDPAALPDPLLGLVFVPSPTFLFPPKQPGRTDFTIMASDSASSETTAFLPIVLISEARNFLVTNAGDDINVPGTLRHAIENAKNDDMITFALPSYPAIIRLGAGNGPLEINKHLNFRGPGSDRLTITGDSNASGATDQNDVQLFRIFASVTMKGLRLSRGFAETGGAIYIGRKQPGAAVGSLSISDCEIANCLASRWGGAIDVVEGLLNVDRCVFVGNALSASSGQGGGAISLYTNEKCSILNTTFSGNIQASTNGIGGGALYVENFAANRLFNTVVTHCTFAENIDLSAQGSAVHNNVSNSRIDVTNTIFNDFSSRNLMVAGGGQIVSAGGNISDDNTSTTFIQGGVPQEAFILNQATDKRGTDAKLAPFGVLESRTQGHRLLAGSPAIGTALGGITPLDQRGVMRDGTSDMGAVDATALERLVIHEIFSLNAPTTAPVGPAPPQFIEFYNPRDQGSIDIQNFEVWVDGSLRHIFTGSRVIDPGFGIVLSDGPLPTAPDPGAVITPAAAPSPPVPPSTVPGAIVPGPLLLKDRSRIELRAPSVYGTRTVAETSYVAVYADSAAPATSLDFKNNSITLAPQFQGSAFVPHKLVLAPPNGGVNPLGNGDQTSPGSDAGGTPFGAPNAFPIAIGDSFEFTEDQILDLSVLANDFDADGSDKIFVVDLNPATSTVPPATDNASALTAGGASISISPVGTPLRGTSVTIDPTARYNSLPEGARVTDSFAYSIVDVGGGAVTGYSDDGAGGTWVNASSHRLDAADVVIISGSGVFDGSHVISAVESPRFSIPVPFPAPAALPAPDSLGTWQAAVPRTPTSRDEALVQLTIRGVNDAPLPEDDQVFTSEETVLRIFADPDLAGVGMSFNTDALYPSPRLFAAKSMLENDLDPDTDDIPFTKLHVVGVTMAEQVIGYSQTPGSGTVTVSAPSHGLANGETILISGYGGDSSYNGYHIITVSGDPDSFELPIPFKDDDAEKGLWTVLNNGNRFSTTSALGAEVTLDIRANRAQTNAVYNPRPSAYLDGLAIGETETDFFYYAVEDTHGAVSLAKVSVDVAGENDAPILANDPPSLAGINPILLGGLSLPEFFSGSDVLFETPSSTGDPDTTDVAVRPPGGDEDDIVVVAGIPRTDEDTSISLSSAELMSNDSDVDRTDIRTVEIVGAQNKSRSGADISLAPGGATVVYDPRLATGPTGLQALSEGERLVDTFEITVFDGTARVTSLVAVLVEGRNDQPIAGDITFTTPENVLLVPTAPGVLANGTEIDQNVKLPDDRKFLFPALDVPTTVFGAKVSIALEQRFGTVESVGPVAGVAGATEFTSTAHGLQTGEEVRILNSGSLTGQYPVTRVDDDKFSVELPFLPAFSSLSGGDWAVLLSDFRYDPRESVFGGGLGGPAFTLQGLAVGQTYSDTYEFSQLDGSYLFANDDIFRVEADRSEIELRVLLNDTNLEGLSASRSIIAVSRPNAGGSVSINGGESLIYTPQTGFVGDEIMVYTIEDDLGNRDTAKVTARVTIDRLNGNLRANDDSFTVAKGQSPLLDVLANDAIIPAAGSPLQITRIATSPNQGGQVTVEAGKVRYTPDAAAALFPYSETFSYTISGGGTASATATATVLVLDRSNLLNVRDDDFSVPAGGTEILLNVLQNDNVLPGTGDELTVASFTAPANGTVTIFNDIAIAYTPNPGYLGPDTFTYTASDGLGGGGTARVDIQVGYLTTNNDFFSVAFDDSTKATDDGPTELDVLANDNVLQGGGGLVTITSVTPTNTALGTMSRAAGFTSLSFDPAEDQIGQQEYVYTITDAGGRTATGTVTVVVLAEGIRASSDFYTVQTGSEENELNVLANDKQISAGGGALTVIAIGTGGDAPNQGGTAVIGPDSDKIIYSPASGFSGVETFTYTITDGTATDTASVSIRSTTGALAAGKDAFLVYRGSENNRLPVLSNDRVIPDTGQLLFVTAVGLDSGSPPNPPNRGTLEIIEDGAALSYTPSPDNTALNYTETFTYEISSGGTDRSEALITIEVLDRVGVRNLETNHDVFSVRSDSAGAFLSVISNDGVMPASAAGWFITEVTQPTANVCSPFLLGDFSAPAVLAAKLSAMADPLSTFLWPRFDPASQAVLLNGSSTDLQLQIALVEELNDVVNSASSIYDATRFAGVTLRAATQALIDEGATGERLLVLNRLLLEDGFPTDIREASSGGVAQIINNEIFYAPQQGFVGTQRFTYRVSDGLGGTGFAEIIVKVGDISVSDDRFTLVADSGAVTLDVTANDGILRTGFPTAPDPDQADFSLSQSAEITVVPSTAGVAVPDGETVSFTPSPTFSGSAVLTYQVDDDSGCRFPGIAYLDIRAPGGDRDTATVTINVTGVNDAPFILNADPNSTDDETALNPFANATVIEYDDQRAQEVVIRVSYPHEHGTLSGSFTEISPGILEFRGTAAEITAALRALVYSPFPNRIIVGTTEDTQFTVSLDDGFVATPVIVDSVVTTVTPVNQAPVITGTVASQRLYQYFTLRPFVGVNITEIDDLTLQPEIVTVSIDDPAKGRLLNLGGFSEEIPGSGEYIFRGTAFDSSIAIRGLVFEPTPGSRVTPGSPETAIFTISVDDSFAPPVIDTTTTVIILHGEIDRLLPLDSTGQDFSQAGASFGRSVSVSGNTMAVGSPLRDTPADAGSVFIYERDAGFGAPWGQVAELKGSDNTAGGRFGHSVAIDGDFMVIGAPYSEVEATTLNVSNPNNGFAYVFQRDPANANAWIQVAKLICPVKNPRGGDAFGAAVTIQGSTVLVGAPNSDFPGITLGGRVFEFSMGNGGPGDWTHTSTLVGSDNRGASGFQEGEFFGVSVAIDGNSSVIGASGANKGVSAELLDFGAAYVFSRTAPGQVWTEIKKLENFASPDANRYDRFGFSVDISGERIVVGSFSPRSLAEFTRTGAVYVYQRDTGGADNWGQTAALSASDGPLSINFGASVAISDDLLMVGSPGPSREVPESRGFVELFRWSASTTPMWKKIDRFSPGSPTAVDGFGRAVAIDRFIGVVGVNTDSVNQLSIANAGSARVYQFQYDTGPRLAISVRNLVAEENVLFTHVVDPSTFGDPNYEELTLSVELNGGGILPPAGWLSFDSASGTFSGTPVPANRDPYTLVLVATNPLGSRLVSNPFTITIDGPGVVQPAYVIWSDGEFTATVTGNPALEASVWGKSANPDGDDNDNLLEMLFGTNPNLPDVPDIVFTKLNATQVSLEFPRSLAFPVGDYEVEWSINMVDWFTAGVSISETPGIPNFMNARAVVTLPTPEQKLFVRVVALR
jgi:VCBS repeat-containing protein